MGIRARLLIPALAAVVPAIVAGGASAATLFTSNDHQTRVTVGASTTATSEGPIDFTFPTGTIANRCTHATLTVRVAENGDERSVIEVFSSHFGTCHSFVVTGTHATPWRITITGNGTMVGGSQAYPSTIHSVGFDFSSIPGHFTGNLENVTVTQNTTTTTGLCIDLNDASRAFNPQAGLAVFVDGKFCLTQHPASTWSLT